MNRNSIKTYHELAGTMPISYSQGIVADIRRERIRKEQAIEAKAREQSYQARTRSRPDQTPGDRVVNR